MRSYKRKQPIVAQRPEQPDDPCLPPAHCYDAKGRIDIAGMGWSDLGLQPRHQSQALSAWLEASLPRLLGLYGAGASVRQLAAACGVAALTMHAVLKKQPQLYEEAQQLRAEEAAQIVEDTTDKVIHARMLPERAVPAMRGAQWTAEKRDRNRFGATRTELTGRDGGPIEVDQEARGRVISKLIPEALPG